ncbi:MAG: hypothetical protein WCJ35_03120 [Planctomycetota bacterium]
MPHENHPKHDHQDCCGCCASVNRRDFLTTVGISALAAQSGLLGFATAAVAGGLAADAAKPRVRVAFLRPKVDRYWMGWPGACYDIKAREADYRKTMSNAAVALGVNLEFETEPIADMAAVNRLLAECKQNPPDGVILTVGSLHPDYWAHANKFAAEKGDLPTVIFSPMGTSFTDHLQATRKAKKCFVAATQDYTWLATAVRMFRTIWDMQNTRLCIIDGDKTEDQKLKVIGTTLHRIPLNRWTEELAKQEVTAEVKALAEELSKTAQKIIEPKNADVLNAAKNYFVARRIMVAENCQGISLNCLGLVGSRRIPCPPCMAWQRLNDEGSVGCCECDWNAAISLRLCGLLTGRPGFMQDPAPNTVNGTLMGAHCSSPTKLRGFDQPAAAQILRSHSESEIGVSPQVLWPLGEAVTVMKFEGPERIILGTGIVVANIDTPPSGGCRTSVELKMDNVADPLDCKGFHQLFILGKHDRLFQSYCQLAGIEVIPV